MIDYDLLDEDLDEGIYKVNNLEKLNRTYQNSMNVEKVVFDIRECTKIDLGEHMFYNCQNLKEVTFVNPVGIIHTGAFMNTGIEKFDFINGVEEIEDDVFNGTPLNVLKFHKDCIMHTHALRGCDLKNLRLSFDDSYQNLLEFYTRLTGRQAPVKNQKVVSDYPLKVKVRNFDVTIGKKRILHDVNIDIEPGEMVLVMGSSGTGKTTLLKHVFGIEPCNHKIEVSLNDKVKEGTPMSPAIQKMFNHKIYYSPQFLICNENLTVRQVIDRQCLMIMHKTLKDQELDDIFVDHGIDPGFKNTLVKNISGGQKKKLLIACSYILESQFLIFDEPDSGLDEVASYHIFIESLKRNQVDRRGKTAIIVSHHPHDYMINYEEAPDRVPLSRIFDKIVVLAKGKEGATVVFCGPLLKARKFFEMEDNEPYSGIIAKITKENGGNPEYYIQKAKKNGGIK